MASANFKPTAERLNVPHREICKSPISNGIQSKPSENRERQIPSPFMGLQGRLRRFVRIRIYRILIRLSCAFRHNRKSRQGDYG